MSQRVQHKLDRLKTLLGRRLPWQERFALLKRMRLWIITAEDILSRDWARSEQELTNEQVGQRFDQWFASLLALQSTAGLSEQEQYCLTHLLQVTQSLRAHLIQCYDLPGLPRTNNEMERYIRALKTRYRRMSGRKNWGPYLLRYGRMVASYECLHSQGCEVVPLEDRLLQVSHQQWRTARLLSRASQQEQRKIWRFRTHRQHYLASLEAYLPQPNARTGLLH